MEGGGGSIHLATRMLRCTAVQYVAGGCDQLCCPAATAAPTAGQTPGLSARYIFVGTTRPPSLYACWQATAWSTATAHWAAARCSSQTNGASRVEVGQRSGVRAKEADVQAVWSLTRSSITRQPARPRRDEAGAALYLPQLQQVQPPAGMRRRTATLASFAMRN